MGEQGRAAEPGLPQGVPWGPEATVFLAKMTQRCLRSQFSGEAIVVHPIDANWVVSMDVLKVHCGSGVKAGQRVNFAIHSPARDLQYRDEDLGEPIWFFYKGTWLYRAEVAGVLLRQGDSPR